MKKIIPLWLLANLMVVSAEGFADTTSTGCLHEGKNLAPFDSVWLSDSVLIKEHISTYKSQGLSQTQIDSRLKGSDWTGFRLTCQPIIQYKPVELAEVPGEAFTISGYVLTFNEYSMDFYLNIQEQLAAKKASLEKSE